MTKSFHKRGLQFGIAAIALLGLCAAPMVRAQNQDQDQGSDMSDEDADQMMTVAIGCVSAYDLVLAKGQGGIRIKQIKTYRALARSIYQELGQLSDDETDQDIAKSDQTFPEVIAKGDTPLTDIEATCDALLSEQPETPEPSII